MQFVATVNNAGKSDAIRDCPLLIRAQAGYSLPVDIGLIEEIDQGLTPVAFVAT